VIEPISRRRASAICDFIQHARTAVSRETCIAKSQCDFSHNVFYNFSAIFSQIRHRVADPLGLFNTTEYMMACDEPIRMNKSDE